MYDPAYENPYDPYGAGIDNASGGQPPPLYPEVVTDPRAGVNPAALSDATGTGGVTGQGGTGGLKYDGSDPIAWANQQMANLPPTSDSLTKIYDALKAGGVNVTRPTHAGGALSDDKLTINGQDQDFIYDVGGPGAKWNQLGAGGGGGGSSNSSLYNGMQPFDYPDFTPQPFNAPTYTPPPAFSYPDYALPTGQEVLDQDPGFAFREGRGIKAITNQASAQGILKTTGTLKSLSDWVSGLASQEYGDAATRSFGVWSGNRQNKAENYDRLYKNTLTDYMTGYNAEADKFNRDLTTYGTNEKNAATKYGFGLDLTAGKSGQAQNQFGNLLDLYKISTASLPTYTPPNYPTLN